MRRLARHLFTLCSAVSLLLCVAVCVLWVRSCRVQDDVIHDRSGVRQIGLGTRTGQVALCRIESLSAGGYKSPRDGFSYTNKSSFIEGHSFLPGVVTTFDRGGFQIKHARYPKTRSRWFIDGLSC
jgi:hypothetical protein